MIRQNDQVNEMFDSERTMHGLFPVAVYLIVRCGRKPGGFRTCESAGIEEVTVEKIKFISATFIPDLFYKVFWVTMRSRMTIRFM